MMRMDIGTGKAFQTGKPRHSSSEEEQRLISLEGRKILSMDILLNVLGHSSLTA